MNFLKTSLLSGISTIVKMLSGIVINKIIAIYIGTSWNCINWPVPKLPRNYYDNWKWSN